MMEQGKRIRKTQTCEHEKKNFKNIQNTNTGNKNTVYIFTIIATTLDIMGLMKGVQIDELM